MGGSSVTKGKEYEKIGFDTCGHFFRYCVLGWGGFLVILVGVDSILR